MEERVLYQPHLLDHPEPSARDEAWTAFVQGNRDDFHRLLGYAISNQGRLAGKAWDRSGFTHPTFWEPSGSGWTVKVILGTMKSDAWVNAINENHQGVGRGTKGTVRHAMLWEVP
jgi:hypothetical protein